MSKFLLIILLSLSVLANRLEPSLLSEDLALNNVQNNSHLETVLKNLDFSLEIGDFEYSEKLIQDAIKDYPDNEILRNKLAMIYTKGAHYKKSYDFIKKLVILEVDKETEEITYDKRYADLYFYQVENLKNLIEVETLNWRKAIYERELFVYYELYLEINNYQDSEGIYDLGNIYMSSEMFQKAMEIFEKDRNKDYRNIFGVAVTSRYLGDYKKSIENYENFIRLEPSMNEAYLGLAQAYQMSGDFDKALAYFDRYLRYEKVERIYVVMANIEIARGRNAGARIILEEAQKIFPNSKDIGDLLIEVYSKIGR